MPHQKSQKIDINTEYPCPCRRKGRLLPIALTEAMGCDRCQKIFVLTDNERVLEQLSSNYPYKCAWRWTGNRWINAYPLMRDNSVALICLIVIVLFCLIFSPSLAWLSLVACMILGAILVLFLCLGFIYWLVDRR